MKNKTTFLFLIAAVVLLMCSIQESFSQGRDRSKFVLGFADTSTSGIDTTLADTTRIRGPVDSTARVKNFKFEREDEPLTALGEYRSSILLYGSNYVDYKVSFDTLGNAVITESVNGEDIKVPLIIPLDKYLEMRSRVTVQDNFYKIIAEKYQIETEDDLEKLFKNITEITIPLPFATETIFGPPTINLKINGIIDITASYQRSTNDLQTITQQNQNQNNINFKQEVQVTTKGTVGDKLTIDADWNSQRTFEFENQLKLKYTGYPDEVIQSIEAGNVSLETRSNLIGSTQALFGVKAQFKLGPLTLTTIASQKKSEKKEVNITGGSVETPFEIPIYSYSENNYLLDESYGPIFEEYYKSGTSPIDVTEIEVWVVSEVNNPQRRLIVGYDSLRTRGTGYDTASVENQDGKILNGFFKKLEPSEYTLNRYAGYITLNGNLQSSPNDAIAVAYKVKENNVETQYGDFVRDVASNIRLRLKLLRYTSQQPPTQNPSHAKLWSRLMKNIYNLGVRNMNDDPNSLAFNIYFNPPGEPPTPSYTGEGPYKDRSWMNITRVDYRVNGNPSDTTSFPKGDGIFDFFKGNTIDLLNGNIIFPILQPFGSNFVAKQIDTAFIGNNTLIYNSSKTFVQENGNIKFVLKGTAKGDASSRYSLGFNLVEGSVKVFNGSVELIAGSDYSIDYSLGELVILNASVLNAGSNLKITYETNDLFQLASKTLLGTRAELQINKTSYIGFTLINLKQQTLNDKIRIGEEPTNNTILGFDASTDIKTNFLTKLINRIPGYNTKDESILNLKGEVAFMLPDPNTKKSQIPSDNGEAVAYVDDFEGVKKLVPLGLNPLSWVISSIPMDSALIPGNTQVIMDSLMSLKRSKLNWYNLLNNVPIKDVYPNKSIASNQNQSLTPLVLDIQPSLAGQFNYVTDAQYSVLNPVNRNTWSGIFKFLNTSQTNLRDENINYIEIWMQVNPNGVNDSAKMIIDLGTISEKIITHPVLKPKSTSGYAIDYHTEDKDLSGTLNEGEDNGIDGYSTSEEKAAFLQAGYNDLAAMTDPSRDDYSWTQGSSDYSKFNGTELNATNLTEAKKIDTEDLNNLGTLNTENSYFEYVIPLDTAGFRNNPYIAGGGNLGWYQFIIPLDDYKKMIGSASLTKIQYARVWFKGFDNNAQIKIVDFNLVGNQWIKQNKNDTSYSVTVVNIEDNSNIYQPPVPGDVLRQRDQTQVDQNVLSNEQSLSLNVSNLLPGQGKFVFKSFITRPLDLINYKILKLFVNGDSTWQYTNPSNHDAEMVIRMGTDTSNYYEYRAPVHPDRRPGSPWDAFNEVIINLSDIAAVKQVRDSLGTVYVPVPNGQPGAEYTVIGNPSIRDIKQIAMGIVNSSSDPIIVKPITGSIWFNEMRVLKTNDESGYAFTLSAGLKIADFAQLNFSYNKTDPNFHNLEGRFGNLVLANSWEISGQVNAHKILNALLSKYVSVKFKDFFTIPVSFSHLEVLDKPKYLPSTDVDLETAANSKYNQILAQTGDANIAQYYADQIRISAQTLRIVNRFSINGMKFTFPGENFFVKQLLNKIEFNFVRNSYTERTPTLESKYAWDWNGNIGLTSDIGLMDILNLKIGKFLPLGEEFKDAKMYFFFPFMPLAPLYTSSISLKGTMNRRRGDEKLRNQLNPNPTSRQFDASRGFNLNWKFIENWLVDVGGDYSFNTGSDLTFLETYNDSLRTQRPEGEIVDDIFFNGGLINWGKDLDYSQTVTINPKFNIPGIRNFLDFTSNYRVTYGWRASQYSNALGSNVGFNSDWQSTAFFKLNEVFRLFKKGDNILGGAYQDDQQAGDILKLLKGFIPDQISMTFGQTKLFTNPAVSGRPGFGNFWMQLNSQENLGPSRFYQLGWATEPGDRIPFQQITDGENINNTISFNTFITPIFPNNLKLNFTYKTSTIKNKTLTYVTSEIGQIGTPISTTENRIITRPSFFVGGDILNKLAKPLTSTTQAKEIAESFENNLVSFPFPSWTLTLNGVEQFEMFKNIAQSITIESGYSSEYKRTINYDGLNPEYLSSQTLTSGFTPLIGVNFSFKEVAEGNLTASFKLSKSDNYSMDPNNAKLTNTATNDISINASFTKSGFSLPLFGLSLDNNLTISFSYTRTKNDPVVYSYDPLIGIWNTNTQNGSTSTTINPSIQYNLSRSVTLQLFYKYNKTEPTGNNLLITTRTSNEAGLNIRLQIQ